MSTFTCIHITCTLSRMIELVDIDTEDTSSTESSVQDDSIKEIRSFQNFCQSPSNTVKPTFIRHHSTPRLLQSIQISNFRASPYSQMLTLHQNSDNSLEIPKATFSRQVSEAHEFSTGYLDFLGKTTDSMYTSVLVKICMWLLAAFMLAVFFVGNHYINDCPEIAQLPYYLSIGGATGFLKIVLIFLRRTDLASKQTDTKIGDVGTDVVLQRYVRYTDTLLTMFLPIWSAIGNVWYYSKPTPNFSPLIYDPTQWCDEVLYEWVLYKLVFTYMYVLFLMIYIVFLTIAYYSLGEPVLLNSGFMD